MDENLTQPSSDCPFCLSNGILAGTILAESTGGYLVDNPKVPGTYLIIPRPHATALTDLPDDWWTDVKTMLQHVPDLGENYNLSINIGRAAGQSLAHIHFWIVPRTAGKPSSGKGLALLINEADNQAQR